MAVGDKVARLFFTDLSSVIGLSQLTAGKRDGTVPLVGTVVDEPGGGISDVVWPTGNRSAVLTTTLLTLIPLGLLSNDTLRAVEGDLGKWVQIIDWPYRGGSALLALAGVMVPARSPAASGLITDIWGWKNESNEESLIIWIEVQNGQAHIPVFMTEIDLGSPLLTPLEKPYLVQGGRRAVGFN